MKKILENTNQKNQFVKRITRVRDEANKLLDLYHASQPFERINKREDAESLLMGAAGYFDQCVLRHAPFEKGASKNFNIDVICNLLNLDREAFIFEAGRLISWTDYKSHTEFLTFTEGQFIFNDTTLQKHLDSFDIYAVSETAIAHVTYLENVRDLLNEAAVKFKLSSTNVEQLAKMFSFQHYENKLSINPFELAKTIQYLNTK
jgi:hypothetical protein